MISLVAELVFCCWGGLSNKFRWGQVDWECSSSLSYPWWFFFFLFNSYSLVIFCLCVLSLVEIRVLKLSITIVDFLCSYFQFCFCFIYFETLLLYAYIFLGLIFLPDEFFNLLQFTFKLLLCPSLKEPYSNILQFWASLVIYLLYLCSKLHNLMPFVCLFYKVNCLQEIIKKRKIVIYLLFLGLTFFI